MVEKEPFSYCKKARDLPEDHLDRLHHDHVHGFPVRDDCELFGRLILEINQAGLSWHLMLKKQHHFHRAFEGFDIARVAAYGDAERQRLLQDEGIIRNKRKIDAVIHNAGVILGIREESGSFKNWLDAHHPLALDQWVRLFRRTFRFMGPEIVNEFLMSTGYLPGAHDEDCPLYQKVLASGPAWVEMG